MLRIGNRRTLKQCSDRENKRVCHWIKRLALEVVSHDLMAISPKKQQYEVVLFLQVTFLQMSNYDELSILMIFI